MTIYLVRHAHAGSRSGFSGHDFDRPLSAKGRVQAEHLRDLLADAPIDAVYSSGFARCLQTVEPIADAHGLKVKEREELLEGADVGDALRLIAGCDGRHVVLCSHGDVIPKIIRRLSAAGMESDTNGLAHKGSLWVLEADHEGRIARGRYLPPGVPDD